jgi:tRNA 2-selenouridine synthase
MEYLEPGEFLKRSISRLVIDVRSQAEFNSGHIPGAMNLPLFDNEERKEIGILYKNSGKQASILRGLDIVGPKMSVFVKTVLANFRGQEVYVHCWRGGMRSSSMAWLIETSGIQTFVLDGGYRSYRRFIRSELNKSQPIVVLGGKTGSGKSEILREMAKMGEQIIDLEKLANHRGSAFGALGQEKQPTTEQFENDLYFELTKLDRNQNIWLEDESRAIGNLSMPEPFFNRIRKANVIFIDVPKEIRVNRLVKDYAGFDPVSLKSAIMRIQKRLGGLNTKLALQAVDEKDFATAASILLDYYDKAYLKGLSNRDHNKVIPLEVSNGDPNKNAGLVLACFRENILRNQII